MLDVMYLEKALMVHWTVIYCSIVVDLCRVEAPNGMESDSYCLESHDEF